MKTKTQAAKGSLHSKRSKRAMAKKLGAMVAREKVRTIGEAIDEMADNIVKGGITGFYIAEEALKKAAQMESAHNQLTIGDELLCNTPGYKEVKERDDKILASIFGERGEMRVGLLLVTAVVLTGAFFLAGELAGSVDLVETGRTIMSDGWSLIGAVSSALGI